MTRDEIESVLVQALRRVAPETDARTLPKDADLRETLDIDSMDFLTFITALSKTLGVSIAEADYPQLFTLGSALELLEQRVQTSRGAKN